MRVDLIWERLLVQELSLRIMFPVRLLLGLLNWSSLHPLLSHSLMLLFQLFHVVWLVSGCLLLGQCVTLDIFISHWRIVLDTIFFQLLLDAHLLVT